MASRWARLATSGTTPPNRTCSSMLEATTWASSRPVPFIDDEHGVENRHTIGVDKMMLEIDFPHSDSNWPNSRKRAAEVLANVPDDEVTKIAETNARELFHFPRAS